MNKYKKLLSCTFILFISLFFFGLSVNAYTIKETTKEGLGLDIIKEDTYIIGITKFNNVTMTGDRIVTATYNDSIFNWGKPDYQKPTIYFYIGNDIWYAFDENNNPIKVTDEEIKSKLSNPDIYYVNNIEKTIEIKYQMPENAKISTNNKAKDSYVKAQEVGTVLVPASITEVNISNENGDKLAKFTQNTDIAESFDVEIVQGLIQDVKELGEEAELDNNKVIYSGIIPYHVKKDAKVGDLAGYFLGVKVTEPVEYKGNVNDAQVKITVNDDVIIKKWSDFALDNIIWSRITSNKDKIKIEIAWVEGNTQTILVEMKEGTLLDQAPQGKIKWDDEKTGIVDEDNTKVSVDGDVIKFTGKINWNSSSDKLEGNVVGFTIEAPDIYKDSLNEIKYTFEGKNEIWGDKDSITLYKVVKPDSEYSIRVTWEEGNIQEFIVIVSKDLDMIDKPISDIPTPTYEISNNEWTTQDKQITINYPVINGQSLTYEYSIDNGKTWISATNPQIVTYTSNGEILARVYNSVATVTTDPFVVDKIDKEAPVISSVEGNTDSWTTSKILKVIATDNIGGVGLAENAYSFDNGNSWQGENSKEITENGTYNIKVKDKLDNISDVTSITVDKVDNESVLPTVNVTGVTTKSITVEASCTSLSGITQYEFSIDNGVTYVNNGTINTYTFGDGTQYNIYLTTGTYNIKVRCTNGAGTTGVGSTTGTTASLTKPTYSVSSEGWAQSKTVTINYPEGYAYSYKVVSGTAKVGTTTLTPGMWYTTTSTTQQVVFTSNGSIIAEVGDGLNSSEATSQVISGIDTSEPIINLDSIPSEIDEGDSYSLPSLYTNDNPSGSDVICKDGSAIVTNTSSLVEGTHTIDCTVTTGAGKSATVSKTITVKTPLLSVNLISGMTAVQYIDNNWTVVDTSKKNWYNYENQEWANAVILKSGIKKNVGDIVNVSNEVRAMFVWVPRYEYKIIGTYGKGGSSATSPGEIEVNFISKKQVTANSGYIIPSAFTFGDEVLSGIWVGKFETSGTVYAPTILPNQTPQSKKIISVYFTSSQQFNSYITNGDSHMAKSSEWGTVAYLSQSKYGKYGNPNYSEENKQVMINNCSSHVTGIGADSQDASASSETCTTNTYETSKGQAASTTGNITGIYDMSGGASEYVMGVYNETIGNSGFSNFPDAKYYDNYTTNDSLTACNEGICYGHALSETSNWYEDHNEMVSPKNGYVWLERGGSISSGSQAGIFAFTNNFGGDNASFRSFRVVIVQDL